MQPRKLQRVGARSFGITLPKRWVLDAGLKEHDILFANEGRVGELVLSRATTQAPRTEVTVRLADIEALAQFIVLCYVRNVQTLRLDGDPDYHTITAVKKTLRHLEGYELTAQHERGLEISFLFTDVNITIPHLLQRMVYLLKMTCAALERHDVANVEEFEMSVDRLYHLSKRILNGCLADHRMRAQNGIKSPPDLFFVRTITKRLEMIGDYLFHLREQRFKKEERAFLDSLMAFLDAALVRTKSLGELQEMVKRLRERSARGIGGRHHFIFIRLGELAKDVYQNHLSIVYGERYLDAAASESSEMGDLPIHGTSSRSKSI